MKYYVRPSMLILFLALSTFSCITTTPYQSQSAGVTGGYTETRLAETIFQVRFNANGYSSTDRTSKFLIRRCAELTLEQGKQYFTLHGNQLGSENIGLDGYVFSFPSGQAVINIRENKDDADMVLDAMIIIQETNVLAGGRLSTQAKKTLRSLQTPLQDTAFEGQEMAAPSHGKLIFYTNLSRVKRKPFDLILDQQGLGAIDSHFSNTASPKEFGETNTISKRIPIGLYTLNISSEGCNCVAELEVQANTVRTYQISKVGPICQVTPVRTITYKENI